MFIWLFPLAQKLTAFFMYGTPSHSKNQERRHKKYASPLYFQGNRRIDYSLRAAISSAESSKSKILRLAA